MKKTIFIGLLFILCVNSLLAQIQENQLVGYWAYNNIILPEGTPQEDKEQYGQMLSFFYIMLNADKTAEVNFIGNPEKATWRVEQTTLFIKQEWNGKEKQFAIKFLDKDKIEFDELPKKPRNPTLILARSEKKEVVAKIYEGVAADKKMLHKKWYYISFVETEEEKAKTTPAIRLIGAFLINSTMELKEDGTLILTSSMDAFDTNKEKNKQTWELSADKKTIIVPKKDKEADKWLILKVTDNELVILRTNDAPPLLFSTTPPKK
jgi:hypothetical protein